MPLGRPGKPEDPARLRRWRAPPARPVWLALARRHARDLVALPSGPLGRAADAGVRPQAHHRAGAQGAPRDLGPARRRPAREAASRRVWALALGPRVSYRHSRHAGRRTVPARSRCEPRDLPGPPHRRERRTVSHRSGGPPRVYRCHGAVEQARALGCGGRPAAGGVLAARRHGPRHSPHARAGGRARPRGGRAPARLDALLSAGREYGPGPRGRGPLRRTCDGGARRGPVHHWRRLAVLIVMRHGATEEEVRRVIAVIEEMGYKARPMPGVQRMAVGLVGNDGRVDASRLEGLPGVQDVIHVTKPYKQVSREWKHENTVVRLPGGVAIGGAEVVAIAGPCSVESERQIIDAALLVKDAGAVILRGGGSGGRRLRRRGGGHHPNRRAQHAQLLALEGGRSDPEAGALEAGDVRDDRGAAPLGRVPPRRGEPRRDPV